MKSSGLNAILLLILSVICLTCVSSKTDEQLKLGYHIDKNEVVFVFDVRKYEKVSTEEGRELDFADIDIKSIAVAGEFNDWSRDGWRMQKVSEYIYELRKKLSLFQDKPDWQYKYIINGKYWVEPPRFASNIISISPYERRKFNLVLDVARPNLNGNTVFRLQGYKDAHKVILAGDFNNWDEQKLRFARENEEWVCKIDLPDGKFWYKFIVDGNWMLDPKNPLFENDGEGNLNSILYKGKSTYFKLEGYPFAKRVFLAGNFNQWNPRQLRMHKDGDSWVYKVNLPPGNYYYKFIVDGNWMTDPKNPNWADDGEGNINSVLEVR